MYLRFITQFTNPYGESETGIFMLLKYLRDDRSPTTDADKIKLKELSRWFNTNLETPTRFSNGISKNNANVSLSWFKDSAKDHINKIQEFIDIAESYDFTIERFTSKSPGYIVYEDEYQVSAVPFKADRNKLV
jgi:hypothetical protein